jgi:hypothetical protein
VLVPIRFVFIGYESDEIVDLALHTTPMCHILEEKGVLYMRQEILGVGHVP